MTVCGEDSPRALKMPLTWTFPLQMTSAVRSNTNLQRPCLTIACERLHGPEVELLLMPSASERGGIVQSLSVPLLLSLCTPPQDADNHQSTMRVRDADSVSCHYWLQTEWKCTYPGNTLHRNGSSPSFLHHIILGLYRAS